MNTDILWAATTSLATVALLGVTAAYAWATFQLLKAARRQLWEGSRPRLMVAARTNQGGQFLLIHIENTGHSPARDLRLTIDRSVHQNFGKQETLNERPLFSAGLRSFPPSTPVQFGLGVAFSYLGDIDRNRHPLSFEIRATYTHEGHRIIDTFPIDIYEQYYNSLAGREPAEDFYKKFPDIFSRAARDIERSVANAAAAPPPPPLRGRSWAPWFKGREGADPW